MDVRINISLADEVKNLSQTITKKKFFYCQHQLITNAILCSLLNYTPRTINQVDLVYYDYFHIKPGTLPLSVHIFHVIKSF